MLLSLLTLTLFAHPASADAQNGAELLAPHLGRYVRAAGISDATCAAKSMTLQIEGDRLELLGEFPNGSGLLASFPKINGGTEKRHVPSDSGLRFGMNGASNLRFYRTKIATNGFLTVITRQERGILERFDDAYEIRLENGRLHAGQAMACVMEKVR